MLTDGFWSGGIRRTGLGAQSLSWPTMSRLRRGSAGGVHDELRLAWLARQKQQGKSV